MGGVVVISTVQVVTLGLLVWGIGTALRINRKTLAAIALAIMFYNSGNYGLPLAALAFPKHTPEATHAGDNASTTQPASLTGGSVIRDGAAVQTFVAFTQNLLSYTIGLAIAAWAGTGEAFKGFTTLLRLPVLPTIAVALLARWWLQSGEGHYIPVAIEATARYLSDGLVPIALVTLGAQLAVRPRWPRWRPISMVLVLRLLYAPVQMALLLWCFHQLDWPGLSLWPWPAQSLILTAAVPSAVVTLLLTLEVGGDADLAADCVFWTTVFSCITITVWLVVIRLMPV
jgi:hypothetical protein